MPSANSNTNQRLVQRFLELAAPIVFEARVVDEDHFERLAELARGIGLPSPAFAECLLDLARQEVVRLAPAVLPAIHRAAQPVPDKPVPSEPASRGPTPREPTLRDSGKLSARPSGQEGVRERGERGQGERAPGPRAAPAVPASGSAPAPPPLRGPRSGRATASAPGAAETTRAGGDVTRRPASPAGGGLTPVDDVGALPRPVPLPPPSAGQASQPVAGGEGPDRAARHAAFFREARGILAQGGGFNAQTYPRLVAIAERVGLARSEMTWALEQLRRGGPDAVPASQVPASQVPPSNAVVSGATPGFSPAGATQPPPVIVSPAPAVPPPSVAGPRSQPPASQPPASQPPVSQPQASQPPHAPRGGVSAGPRSGDAPRQPAAPPVVQVASFGFNDRLPVDQFRGELEGCLTGDDGPLSRPQFERLVDMGQSHWGLCRSWSRQIVVEMADKRQVPVAEEVRALAVGKAPAVQPAEEPLEGLDAFREQAMSILARHRGMTPQSRVQLATLGRQRGWTDAQVEWALAQLNPTSSRSAGAAEADPLAARTAEFAEYAASYLSQTHVLTPLEQQWLNQAALLQYGLDEATAARQAAEVAGQMGFPHVTEEAVLGYLSGRVNRWISESGVPLEPAAVDTLQVEGAHWGISPNRVDELVAQCVVAYRAQSRREKRITHAMLVVACAAVVVVVGGFGWGVVSYLARQASPEGSPPRAAGDDAPAQRQLTLAGTGESWWSPETELAAASVRVALPVQQKRLLEELRHPDGTRRSDAYRGLVAQLAKLPLDTVVGDDLRDLLIHCYLEEPSGECAEQLADRLLDQLPQEGDAVTGPKTMEVAFWSADTALETLHQRYAGLRPRESANSAAEPGDGEPVFDASLEADSLAAGPSATGAGAERALSGAAEAAEDSDAKQVAATRQVRMLVALGKRLGVMLRLTDPFDRLRTQTLGALTQVLFRNLVATVERGEPVAPGVLNALQFQARQWLDDAQHQRQLVDYLIAALNRDPDQWHSLEDLLRHAVYSKDPLVVLRMVALLEQTSAESLQTYLSELLQRRIGLVPETLPPAEVAQRVRRELSGSSSDVEIRTGGPRAGRIASFGERAQRAVADAQSPLTDVTEFGQRARWARELVELAHCACLGAALAQGDQAQFEKLASGEPWEPERGGGAMARGGEIERPASPGRQQFVNRLVDRIRRSEHSYERLSLAKQCVYQMETGFSALGPEQAQVLARYLLSAKSRSEHDRLLPLASRLAAPIELKLALVDALDRMTQANPRATDVLRRVVGDDSGEGPGDLAGWKRYWQRRVLALAVRDKPGGDAAGLAELTARKVRAAWETQLALFGGGVPEDGSSAVAPVIAQLIRWRAAQADASAEGELSAFLAALPHRLKAVEFAADGDLAQVAHLQRLWLELLALELAARDRVLGDRAREIIEELVAVDRAQTQTPLRVRSAERALVQMWLVWNEAS